MAQRKLMTLATESKGFFLRVLSGWLGRFFGSMNTDNTEMASHLEDYLAYFKGCDSPGYAVLIAGDWGVGKTFQVKKALKEEERYYVSLFGLESAADVHSAVLATMDPTLAKTKAVSDRIGDTAKDMGGLYALGGILPAVMNAVLRHDVDTGRTLVFDDLERCELPPKVIEGVINTYVEHHGCRVVVIAHDEQLADHFLTTKEKLFGQTIKIEPHLAEAFDAFCSQLPTKEKSGFVNAHRDTVIGTFEASGAKSLRMLKHVIEDVARLHEAIHEDQASHQAAMNELVCLFSALNIEVRSGKLSEEDLRDRPGTRYGYELRRRADREGEPEKPHLLVADERYPSVDLANNLLQDQPIIEMLIKGRYDKQLVQNSLNSSHYFLKPAESPPWKLVISFDDLEDKVVESALKRMQLQFENREVTDSGEMLHIFSLRMMLAEKGVLADDVSEVAEACKAYIDDLLARNELPPRGMDSRYYRNFERSHDGHGYWVEDQHRELFKGIWDHLIAAREKALERLFPELTEQLRDLMKTDGLAFYEQVCFTRNGDNPYALIPILLHIPAVEFVGMWLDSPKQNWRWISRALGDRYDGAQLNHELKAEKGWVREVVKILEGKAQEADGLQALRIERVIPSRLQALDEE